jgi:ribosome assembly protein 4
VRWGGGGLGGKGVLYTASSDRTVRIWEANGVRLHSLFILVFERLRFKHPQGKILHTLKDHAHWVTTLSLNTDFVLRTGPFDHTGKRPTSDEDGSFACIRRS